MTTMPRPVRALFFVALVGLAGCGGVPETTPGAPQITSQPSDVTVAEGSSFSLSVSADGDNLTYQWYKNSVIQFGQTSSTYSRGSASSTDSDSYYVTVTNDSGSVTSNTVNVTVTSNTAIHK
ncbi:hypothetical protein BH11ARM2_BH11ARM2_30680 [soil metagenome]